MSLHPFQTPAGSLEYIRVKSSALEGNMLGDPAERSAAVYLPPSYDAGNKGNNGKDYPLIVALSGFTNSSLSLLNWKSFQETLPQRLDRLIETGKMGEVILALPDCFTSLGGNQYVNSAVLGNWETFLCTDMIKALEAKYPIRQGRDHRAIFGKSSGGYGAMIHGMKHADTWGAIACQSGDMAFELCYLGDLPNLLRTLSDYDNNIPALIKKIHSGKTVSGGNMYSLMLLAMAASYDPVPSEPAGIRLPVTLDTCELIPDRWQNWLDHDPVHLVTKPEIQANLASLKGLYIDCGDKDQYNLLYGARRLSRSLAAAGIKHHYEEFADNHSSVEYRIDESLPYLYACISS